MKVKNISNGDTIENVELATSKPELLRGLMFRERGRMLLDFKKEGEIGIWMPFMRFSLDIAFILENGKVKRIFRNVKPIGLNPKTWKIYRERCRYVLEVEASRLKGWGERDKLILINE